MKSLGKITYTASKASTPKAAPKKPTAASTASIAKYKAAKQAEILSSMQDPGCENKSPLPPGMVAYGYTQDGPYTTAGLYALFKDFSIGTDGIILGGVEAGMAKFEADYEYGGFGLQAVTGEAEAGISTGFTGIKVGGSLVSGDAFVKIPIPFTEKKLKIDGEARFGLSFGIGYDEEGSFMDSGFTSITFQVVE